MSIIGEAFLTASIDILLNKLASPDLLQFASQERIHADLKKWKKKLDQIHAVLNDAEEKQMTNRLVKIWLGDLQILAYDMEDILDEFATEALRKKLRQPQASTSKVGKIITTFRTTLSTRSLEFNVMMRRKIKEITPRIQDIVTRLDKLELIGNSGQSSNKVSERRLTSSLVNEAEVYGREKDKKAIVELLLTDDSSTGNRFSVIPIRGMGGVGKTTLAKIVYNEKEVEDHFDLRAWVCVSEDFNVIRITTNILEGVGAREIGNVNNLDKLHVELKKSLSGKKFLFVLDDIWNENYEKWRDLCRPFEAGLPGSKIVVTTRNQGVSSMVKTGKDYPLEVLSNDDCLRIFAQHSLGEENLDGQVQDMKEIGKEIIRRCNGLPLAATALGGLLRGKHDINYWKNVLNSKIWNLSEDNCDIIPALRISYYYLNSHLKRCFAYFSLFPKNYQFQKEKMILLWMAEGFLQHGNSMKNMEEFDVKYFRELKERSFLQESNSNPSFFVMHDLIHDLAQWAAGEIYFRMETIEASNNLRHLSYFGCSPDDMEKIEASNDIIYLRTLLLQAAKIQDISYSLRKDNLPAFLRVQEQDSPYFTVKDFSHVLLKFQRLRVLSLNGYGIREISNEIGELKHLRYLDLSYTDIKSLPDSVNTLYNLQTLLLEGCARLRKLCTDMGNLIHLHHLNLSNVNLLQQMPLGIGKLTGLQALTKFVVGKGVGSGLAELKSLTHLREMLHISGLENVTDAHEAKEANLNGKENLDVLFLEWNSSSVDNSKQAETQTLVLELLRPHQNLKELLISGYQGTKFATWLRDSSLTKLVRLRLENCGECNLLPSVGCLPSLKHLIIKGMVIVPSVGPEFYGNGCSVPFPLLEILHFEDMKELKDWIPLGPGQEEGFPCLRELHIIGCPKLQGKLPKRLPSLVMLFIENCEQLLVSIPSSPTLCALQVNGCKEVEFSTVDLGLLKLLFLSTVTSRVSLEERYCYRFDLDFGYQNEGLAYDGRMELNLDGKHCKFVKPPLSFLGEIYIRDFPNLVSFLEYDLPSYLTSITIDKCKALESFPESFMRKTSLVSLLISECHSLKYMSRVQLPPNLKWLGIKCCNNLQTLVEEEEVSIMHEESINNGSSKNASLLEHLKIEDCQFLVSLWSKGELPPTVESIVLSNCTNLASLSSRGNLPMALKYLSITKCSKLQSIAEGVSNDTALEKIYLRECESLMLLPDGTEKLCHLKDITIYKCPSIALFPDGGLPSPKLSHLFINECEKLKALPNRLHNLTSLQCLRIERCPSMVSFPKDGFPTSLKRLSLEDVNNLNPLFEWGLHNLTSLECLRIKRCSVTVSFPDDGFPTTITSLEIVDTNICKQLFKWGLHKLTSLTNLFISGGCDEVESFPLEEIEMILPPSLNILHIENFPNLESLSAKIRNLTSLERLILYGCPKLKNFPEQGLPNSHLQLQLYLHGCPLLEERCRRDGLYWPMIAHLPPIILYDSWRSLDPVNFCLGMSI